MKILHVMPSLSRSYGGPTQSWVGYASAACTQGVEVVVAAPRVSKEDQDWLASKTPGADYAFFRSAGKGGMVFSPGLQRWLAGQGHLFDAIHVHGLFNPVSSLALRQCVRKKWPVVLRPFGTLSRYTFNHRRTWMKQRYFRYLDGPSLMKTGGVHFTTPAERDEAMRHGINFAGRSHVVPPPLAEVPFRADVKDKIPTVLFLSRLHPKKNIECLLAAWPSVQQAVPAARLVIAGDGEAEYVQTLKDQAKRLGDGHNIDFAGFVEGEQKSKLLAASTLFVLPSFQENFGVAVMEAISAGLPVVISREVQLADYITKHDLGHVVDSDPEALAFSMIEILKSRAYQDHCRQKGPASIRQDFSLNTIGRQLVDMYEAVINNSLS